MLGLMVWSISCVFVDFKMTNVCSSVMAYTSPTKNLRMISADLKRALRAPFLCCNKDRSHAICSGPLQTATVQEVGPIMRGG